METLIIYRFVVVLVVSLIGFTLAITNRDMSRTWIGKTPAWIWMNAPIEIRAKKVEADRRRRTADAGQL